MVARLPGAGREAARGRVRHPGHATNHGWRQPLRGDPAPPIQRLGAFAPPVPRQRDRAGPLAADCTPHGFSGSPLGFWGVTGSWEKGRDMSHGKRLLPKWSLTHVHAHHTHAHMCARATNTQHMCALIHAHTCVHAHTYPHSAHSCTHKHTSMHTCSHRLTHAH